MKVKNRLFLVLYQASPHSLATILPKLASGRRTMICQSQMRKGFVACCCSASSCCSRPCPAQQPTFGTLPTSPSTFPRSCRPSSCAQGACRLIVHADATLCAYLEGLGLCVGRGDSPLFLHIVPAPRRPSSMRPTRTFSCRLLTQTHTHTQHTNTVKPGLDVRPTISIHRQPAPSPCPSPL